MNKKGHFGRYGIEDVLMMVCIVVFTLLLVKISGFITIEGEVTKQSPVQAVEELQDNYDKTLNENEELKEKCDWEYVIELEKKVKNRHTTWEVVFWFCLGFGVGFLIGIVLIVYKWDKSDEKLYKILKESNDDLKKLKGRTKKR